MHLTPETPTYSMRGCGGLPADAGGVLRGVFATEQACREYLMQLRWPQGFSVCPRCGGRRARPSRRGLLRCGQCDYQASVTAGTIFQDTRLPLRTWFRTMWWVTSQKNGASDTGTAKHLGSGKLPYRLGVAAQAAARDGAARPRTAQRSRGGRRDLCGGRRRGTFADGRRRKKHW